MSHRKKTARPDLSSRQAGQCVLAQGGDYNRTSFLSIRGVNYLYDGDGRRVGKVGSKLYWYGPSDEVLDETDTAGNLLNTYFYFAGKRVEAWPVGSSDLYYSEDYLGSSRIITTVKPR
jgi:hypothetical protein